MIFRQSESVSPLASVTIKHAVPLCAGEKVNCSIVLTTLPLNDHS